jgi:adenosine deaminase
MGKKECDIMNFKNLPKIELHCHIDGSIRPSTILDIAIKEKMDIPTSNLDEFLEFVRAPKECTSLNEYLERFAYPNMVMQSKENIERITYEVMQDAFEDNIKYIELRFAPLLHMNKGLSFDEIVDSARSGLSKAQSEFGIMGNLILCCMRHDDPSKSIELVKSAKKYLNKGVVAIDLAGNEHDFAPELHKEAFDLAKDYGFNITIHAGETGRSENIIKSINLLHASRIGHGVNCKDNREAFDLVKNTGVTLEMCPTSNVQTKAVSNYTSHPIADFYKSGIMINISTDNRTVSNITLNNEYDILGEIDFFNEDDYKSIYLNSVDVSFADEKTKTFLRTLI